MNILLPVSITRPVWHKVRYFIDIFLCWEKFLQSVFFVGCKWLGLVLCVACTLASISLASSPLISPLSCLLFLIPLCLYSRDPNYPYAITNSQGIFYWLNTNPLMPPTTAQNLSDMLGMTNVSHVTRIRGWLSAWMSSPLFLMRTGLSAVHSALPAGTLFSSSPQLPCVCFCFPSSSSFDTLLCFLLFYSSVLFAFLSFPFSSRFPFCSPLLPFLFSLSSHLPTSMLRY